MKGIVKECVFNLKFVYEVSNQREFVSDADAESLS